MKHKELCLLMALALLVQPISIWAAQTDAYAQVEIQNENTSSQTAKSVLEGLSAGADLIGNISDADSVKDEGQLSSRTEADEFSVSDGSSLGSFTEGSVTGNGDAKSSEPDVNIGTNEDNENNGNEDGSADNADDAAEGADQNDTKTDVNGESGEVSAMSKALGEPVGISSLVEADKTREEYAQAYEDAKNANWGYTNLGIANVDNNLNIRAVAAEDGKLVGKLPKDAACEVLDTDDTWAHIKSGQVEGYVSCDYLITGVQAKHRAEELVATVATVTADGLKVRAQASTESEVITQVPRGERLEVVESEGDWIKVYLDDEEVYVSAEYVKVDAELATAITMTELLYGQGVSDVRVDLCQYAKEFLGNPYVWGGTSLTKGADCSGFVLSVFKKFGISLPHYSGSQASCGKTIKLAEAKPGDLVFYGNGKRINHVAIYIGGGQVIHASSPKTGIKISNATYRSPVKVVRIIND